MKDNSHQRAVAALPAPLRTAFYFAAPASNLHTSRFVSLRRHKPLRVYGRAISLGPLHPWELRCRGGNLDAAAGTR